MTTLQLTLDFDCGDCDMNISATVHCEGKGLSAGPRTVAACRVACPGCGCLNRVCFHPTGVVVDVYSVESRVPEPSMN